MDSSPNHRSISELGPAPHTWDQAAEYLAMAQPEKVLQPWLRESGLPGADSLADDGSWPLPDRVKFLKVLCGEKE